MEGVCSFGRSSASKRQLISDGQGVLLAIHSTEPTATTRSKHWRWSMPFYCCGESSGVTPSAGLRVRRRCYDAEALWQGFA